MKFNVVLKLGLTVSLVVEASSTRAVQRSPVYSAPRESTELSVTREPVSLEKRKLGSSSSNSRSGSMVPCKAAGKVPGPTPKSTVSKAVGMLTLRKALTPEA